MQVTNTNQTQTITKTNMNTLQVTLTNEEILLIREILPRFGSIERLIDAHTEDIALLKAKKSGKSKKRELTEEEIAAKQRKQEEKVAKKLAAAQAKADKAAVKEAKKLEKEKAKAAKEAAKEAKKLEKEKAKAEKAATKGPSFDKTYTKKCFVQYRDHKDADAYKGENGSRLRIARKKDGSDPTVYKVAPHNWTDKANAEFDKLENKWDATAKPYSPEFVPKKSASKTTTKPKKKKKVLLSQKVAVSDTDEELDEEKPVEEIPAEYSLYRRYLRGDKSAQTTWRKATPKSHKTATESGLKPLNNWAYKKTGAGAPYQDKIYEKNPEEKVPDEGKDILNEEGKVIGNCVTSFTPVEDKKPAAIEKEESEDESEDESEEENNAVTVEDDGLEEFAHPLYFDRELKIRRSDKAVFDSDKPKEVAFIGYYNEDTCEIVTEIEESEDDGFSSDDMKDTEQF